MDYALAKVLRNSMGVAVTTSEGVPDRIWKHLEKRTSALTVKLYVVRNFNLRIVNVVNLGNVKTLVSEDKPSLINVYPIV